jgi:hypothetical protein
VGAAVALGVGGASAVVGAVFGGLALAKKGELGPVCPEPNQCARSAQGTVDAMNAFATVSTVGVVAAVAGAAAGTILLITDGGPASRTSTTLSIGPGYAGFRVRF